MKKLSILRWDGASEENFSGPNESQVYSPTTCIMYIFNEVVCCNMWLYMVLKPTKHAWQYDLLHTRQYIHMTSSLSVMCKWTNPIGPEVEHMYHLNWWVDWCQNRCPSRFFPSEEDFNPWTESKVSWFCDQPNMFRSHITQSCHATFVHLRNRDTVYNSKHTYQPHGSTFRVQPLHSAISMSYPTSPVQVVLGCWSHIF